MIYQLRVFTDHPGRRDAHVDRFREHTCRLLEKHGIKVVGCWVTATEEHGDQVVFITAHESYEAMRSAQQAFAADPEQNAMVRDSEKDGPIIHHSDNWYLQPTDFSPLQQLVDLGLGIAWTNYPDPPQERSKSAELRIP